MCLYIFNLRGYQWLAKISFSFQQVFRQGRLKIGTAMRQLSDRLVFLGIMRDQLRALLIPSGHHESLKGLRGALSNWGPTWFLRTITALSEPLRGLRSALNRSPIVPRDASLSDSRWEFFQFESFAYNKTKNSFFPVRKKKLPIESPPPP